jgi:hypothetical protein
MTENAQKDVTWSPRVPQWKVRRLYQLESKGVYDDELLDDVGWMLYERCRDILTIHDALNGVVTCPRCANAGQTSRVPRMTHAREEVLACPTCGWALTWYDYHLTFKRQQLNPGGATAAFAAYVRDFALARTPQAKMLAIDQVIHAFHYSLRDQPDQATRPAGVNLIVGNLTEVIRFLDELSGIPNSAAIQATDAAWRQTLGTVSWLKLPEPEEAGSKMQEMESGE